MQKRKEKLSRPHRCWLVAGFTSVALFSSNQALAVDPQLERYDETKPSIETSPQMMNEFFRIYPGILFKTRGGLEVRDECGRFWFKLGGTMRFDETLFMANADEKRTDFMNSGFIRHADFSVKGGFGCDWEYAIRLRYVATETRAQLRFGDANLTYLGIADNTKLTFGHVTSPFSLDNENSTSWQPFLETSLVSDFFPNSGLGFKYGMWWDHWSFKVSGVQPDHGAIVDNATSPSPRARDRWIFAGRLVHAPINCYGDVLHLGIGGTFEEIPYTAWNGSELKYLNFRVNPEAQARYGNQTDLVQLVEYDPALNPSLATGNLASVGMRASLVRKLAVEFARQCGPFGILGEYFYTHVKRPAANSNPSSDRIRHRSADFHGWWVTGSWILTGESREYDIEDGAFSTIRPTHCYGAWEIAARYSYINLNSKDIKGGSEHNLGLALNWFYNEHVRMSLNYIRANIHPAVIFTQNPRHLDILAGRVQVRW